MCAQIHQILMVIGYFIAPLRERLDQVQEVTGRRLQKLAGQVVAVCEVIEMIVAMKWHTVMRRKGKK